MISLHIICLHIICKFAGRQEPKSDLNEKTEYKPNSKAAHA